MPEAPPAPRPDRETLTARLAAVGRSRSEHPAIVEAGGIVTYRALVDGSLALAARLRAAGAGRGTRVAMAFPNGPAFARSFFAVARLGGVVVPLNPSLQAGEIAPLVADAGVSLMLSSPSLSARCMDAVVAAGRPADSVLVLDDGPDAAPAGTQAPALDDEPDAGDPALVLYSSGSTGQPRRVERTHAQLLYETDRLIEALQLSSRDRVLGVAPFSHVNGLMRSLVASAVSGATLVTMPRFERRQVGELIGEHRVSVFVGVPFMFAMLAETRWPRPVDFTSLRHCISSSAPLPPETSRRFHARYGIFVRQLYGTTETGTISVDLDPGVEDRLDSVGRPLPGVEVEIFAEDQRQLPAGEVGEIGVKSPAGAHEYPGSPDASRAAFSGGYFFPGDLGRKDADGRLFLVGRKSLFINRAGYKVNPQEVESILERHPAVAEAAVVGVDTPYGDQQIKAVIVLRAPCREEQIVEFCRGRIADFKVPSVVEFRSGLPRSATGKILRMTLR